MKALMCEGRGVRFATDRPEPRPGPDEVTLDVRCCGICDTDVQLAAGYMGYSGILGHEFVGADAEGKRFTAEINNACRNCDWCKKGLGNHCPNRTVLGILKHDGAMAEKVAVPRANLHAIPDSIPDESAVFVEPLAAAFRILEQIRVERTDRVAVLGDGKLGTLCAWVLATAADHVTLIGKHPSKLERAGDSVGKALLDEALANSAKSFDLVVDATGNASGLETACQLVRARGTICLKTTIAAEHSLSLAPIVIDELTVVGSRCGPFAPAIEALAAGRFDVARLIEAIYPLNEAEAAFAHAARKGAAKILLKVR
ncbi:alcohol dehydrogenase catalytic domain-containing protein [bacterium]|nr:alcohol dehydrogenase catalytic domain-containing protein [bacterium]